MKTLVCPLVQAETNRNFLFSDKEYWYEAARSALRRRLQQYVASGGAAGGGASRTPLVARNVIIFVGDGLGVATATAARILRGQREGLHGEDAQLAWDKFPAVALSKVRNNSNKSILDLV